MTICSICLIPAGMLLCSGLVFAQGDFAHLTYGAGYQTTFTLVNLSTTDPANVSLSFYSDDGTPLQADVQGVGPVTPYNFTLASGASKTVALVGDTAAAKSTQGWAHLVVAGGYPAVRGQASFRRRLNGLPDFEAVVPLTNHDNSNCIHVYNPNPTILLPFDNTNAYLTALAFANSSGAALPLQLEYDDESNQTIISKTLVLPPNNHTSFVSTLTPDGLSQDPILAGKKGVLRIQAGSQYFAVLGLQFNSTGPYTAILPISQ